MYNRKPMMKKKEGLVDAADPDLSFSKIMKDVQLFASSHMTWKDKKALENQNVTQLGGKTQKKQRLPLSVARVQMKKQKDREDKMLEQNMILGQFGGTSRKKPAEKKTKPEERVLKSTFGNFRGGVLDVKDLLRPGSYSRTNGGDNKYGKNKSKGIGGELRGGDIKKNRKKKGGGKRKSKKSMLAM
ncbi:unnamed protein product [Eruca vesicaria subsp. sativa]|uniref:Uncharacterized protein n=1 Tax=Eruca vesicaria subsp. sativa TaxID=29727 RepID=A0ABC8LZY0_ERUVS|nr:unnamed protein product [Eruca vesicaria subsp. sativa]